MKTSKLLTIVFAALMLFIVPSITFAEVEFPKAEEESSNITNTEPSLEDVCGCSSSDIFVQGQANISGYVIGVDDFYMSAQSARILASELDTSWQEAMTYLAIAWMGGEAGKYISTYGGLDSVYRGTIATQIRNLTNQNKDVYLTIEKDYIWGFKVRVKEWDLSDGYSQGRYQYKMTAIEWY